jgi:AmiR/NasT family two-component response regulator
MSQLTVNDQQNIEACGKHILLGESQIHTRELLVNQLLMAGAGQVAVAVDGNELIRSLYVDRYDLVLLGQSVFAEKQVKKELEMFHRKCDSGIIVLLDDEEGSLTTHKLYKELKGTNVYLCVLRSTAASLLRIILNG